MLVFGADHIYKMNIRQMTDFHFQKNAIATIACLPIKTSEASEFGIRALVERIDLGPEFRGHEFLDDADAHAFQIFAQRRRSRFHRTVDARGVHRIVPGHSVVGQRRVFHSTRQRTDLIEARRKGDQAVSRDAAICGLETDDVAKRARFANRPAGVAAQPDGGFDEEVKTGAARKGGVPPPIVRETRTLPEYV